MVNYTHDRSSLQVVDYASLIWNTNQAIMESIVYGNNAAIPPLVDHLETLLYPYIDSMYKEEVKSIDEMEVPEGNTPNEQKHNLMITRQKQMVLTHRSLMALAYRNRLLPATASVGSDFFLEEDLEEEINE
nr:hypothetical protein [uncultured Methanolobus sp.]